MLLLHVREVRKRKKTTTWLFLVAHLVVFTVWEPLRCRAHPGAASAPSRRKHPPPLPPEPVPVPGTSIFSYSGSSWSLNGTFPTEEKMAYSTFSEVIVFVAKKKKFAFCLCLQSILSPVQL